MVSINRMKSAAQRRAEVMRRELQDSASTAGDFIGSLMRDYPVAVGAGFFALGLACGLVIPRTRPEDQWLGPVRDNLVHRARRTGRELIDRGEEMAEQTLQKARAAVQCAADVAAGGEASGSNEERSQSSSTPPPMGI